MKTILWPNLIRKVKEGDTYCAGILLMEASEHLQDDSNEGKTLREYIQNCLKSIPYTFLLEKTEKNNFLGATIHRNTEKLAVRCLW